ncbi:hypothetical protein LTR37_014305 [Vermiconidia calcicola]|uniref:Uncharacterized protein n=1 Tax=Vermiconidia calcicola TaxID=1690605 RepID=A0ACC3MUQ6_9PEZI|nr:hypothetical protein LTR37_014305 [Vermiconidia calcicola]
MAIDAGQTATLGHEGAGYIEKMHSSVESKGYKKGDPVGFFGKQLLQGFTTDGFFAEYAVVDEPNCIHLPAAIDVGTAVDSSELKEGDWLAVVGAGGLERIATQIAKARGCKVVAIDINDDTLEVCKGQGADAVFNSRTEKDYVEELKKLTNGGAKAACVFSNAQAVIGLPHDPIPVSTIDLALGKYKVKSESTSIPQRMKKAVDFLAEHKIVPEVQHRKLEELNDMVNDMKGGKATKRMLVTF